jgi:hypothetical protein
VSRTHDIGGQTGFGPVPARGDGQRFTAGWEARVYALNAVLRRRGVCKADQMRHATERIPPQRYGPRLRVRRIRQYEDWIVMHNEPARAWPRRTPVGRCTV